MIGLSALIVLYAKYSFAAEGTPQRKGHFRIGLGLGISYGVIGSNFECSPIEHSALTVGVGIAPGGLGWTVGGRIYFLGKERKFRPRFSILHGTVAILETRYLYGRTDYRTVEGNALGAGFELGSKKSSFDFDFIVPDFKIPEGYEKYGPPATIAIGYGFHF